MRRDRDALHDILDSARLIERYTAGLDREAFDRDVATQDAVIRRFEIIGEATKRLSPELRGRHQGVPWRAMASMRDRVIHGYDTVDLEMVWKTVKEDLPPLRQKMETILSEEDTGA